MQNRTWSFESERLKKGARTTLLLVIALAALAVWKPTWQWFPIGLVFLLLLALCVAIAPVRRQLFPGHPVVPWSLLVATSWLFVIHSYYVELRRQRSERLELLGVQLWARRLRRRCLQHGEHRPMIGGHALVDLAFGHAQVQGLVAMGQRVLPRGEPVELHIHRLHAVQRGSRVRQPVLCRLRYL